jgi:amicyanin
MNRNLGIFLSLAVAVLVAATGAIAYVALSPRSSDTQVSIVDYAFRPMSVTIRAGTTVHWMNMDTVAHTVTFGSHDDMGGGMGSDMLGHMGTYQYRFMEPGTYEYHCDPHPYMTGTVVVTA